MEPPRFEIPGGLALKRQIVRLLFGRVLPFEIALRILEEHRETIMGKERSVLFCILDESIPVLETVRSSQRIVVDPSKFWPICRAACVGGLYAVLGRQAPWPLVLRHHLRERLAAAGRLAVTD